MRFRKILLASAALTLGSSLFLANNNSINVQAAETQNNTFTLHIASYVYNKSGKQVHVDELKMLTVMRLVLVIVVIDQLSQEIPF